MKIKVNKEQFVRFLKLVNFNGLVKDVTLSKNKNSLKAFGSCPASGLVFDVNLKCESIEGEGKINIFDIGTFLKILERFNNTITILVDDEKIIIKEKSRQATIRCNADTEIDSFSRVDNIIKIENNTMKIIETDSEYDFNSGIKIKVDSKEISELTKNTDAIASTDYNFMFDLKKEKLTVESSNFNNDSFKQEVEIEKIIGNEDKDGLNIYFNYGIKEVFANLADNVEMMFLDNAVMIRNKVGRIIISAQQG